MKHLKDFTQLNEKKAGEVICSGCFDKFDPHALKAVEKDGYTTPYCDKCIKEEKIPASKVKGNYFAIEKERESKQGMKWGDKKDKK